MDRSFNLGLALLFLLLILSCNCENDSNIPIVDNSVIDSLGFQKTNSKSVITKFLFLKKGMNIKEVKDYLDANSIKYSNLKNSIKQDFQDEYFPFNGIKYFDVYNYPIDNDVILDNLRLYFADNKIYMFKYYKVVNETDFGNQNRGYNKVNDFKSQYIGVIRLIYEGLKLKYGNPDLNDWSNSDTLVTYYSSNSVDKNCNFFDVSWNSEIDSLGSETELSINLGNSLCIWKKELFDKKDYSYNQFIKVYFNNKEIDEFIKMQIQLEGEKQKKVIDSQENKKQKFIDNL